MRYFVDHARDPVSSFTHFLGACLSILMTILMLVTGLFFHSSLFTLFSCTLFCFALFCMYGASTLYHFYKGRATIITRLRKLDHAMIYVLISGTYTPLAAAFLPAPRNSLFLLCLWSASLLGIVLKIFWLSMPRLLSTGIYILLGWSILFDLPSFSTMPSGCLILLLSGGFCYTTGAILYCLKKPNFTLEFGFHEVFHLCILAGSIFHFLAIFFFVLL